MPQKKPTSFDIAQLVGVSQPTVSRALRGSSLVSEDTRRRVFAAAQKLNYKVDFSASNLRSGRTNTIGVIFNEDHYWEGASINPFFMSMLGSLTKAATHSGYDLLISTYDSKRADALPQAIDRSDGIIFLGYGHYNQHVERIRKLEDAKVKFITWGPVIEDQPGCFIGCDNTESAKVGVSHLLKSNRRRIAFIGNIDENCPEFQKRYGGYLLAHADNGVSPEPVLRIDADSTETDGALAIDHLMALRVDFDGIFAATDLIALGALKRLSHYGKCVPQDIAIVGFDDIPNAAYSQPPLTTIRQDTQQAGELLIRAIIQLINDTPVSNQRLKGELLIRESCGSLT